MNKACQVSALKSWNWSIDVWCYHISATERYRENPWWGDSTCSSICPTGIYIYYYIYYAYIWYDGGGMASLAPYGIRFQSQWARSSPFPKPMPGLTRRIGMRVSFFLAVNHAVRIMVEQKKRFCLTVRLFLLPLHPASEETDCEEWPTEKRQKAADKKKKLKANNLAKTLK